MFYFLLNINLSYSAFIVLFIHFPPSFLFTSAVYFFHSQSQSKLFPINSENLLWFVPKELFSKYAIAIRTSALKEEKYAARRAIVPVLQAEEDER